MTSPKADFLSDKERVKAWNDLAESRFFKEAIHMALLETLHRARGGAVYEAQAAMHKLEGARQFAAMLTALGIAELPAAKPKAPALEHDDYGVPIHLRPLQANLE